jgi:lipopolysaccharide assembly outer membrane protein LptD (OstA)
VFSGIINLNAVAFYKALKFAVFTALMALGFSVSGQESDTLKTVNKKRSSQLESRQDSTAISKAAESIPNEIQPIDSTSFEDIISAANSDSTISEKKNSSGLDSEVTYSAKDSIMFDVKNKMVYLFGDAEVHYEEITLKAEYIEVDQNIKEVFAKGLADSTGKIVGQPVFSEGGEEFKSQTMRYNFDTKKGRITSVITAQGEGHLHGKVVKKSPQDFYYIKNGGYTTCDQDTPHFIIAANKLKVIPNDKIVSGPAYLKLEGISTPLVVPFGFFPNKEGRKSGILMPEYGDSPNQGFFFRGLGYYFALGETIDLAIRGDIYTQGSYGVNLSSRYKRRYRFSGSIELSHSSLRTGDPDFPNYEEINNFFVRWKHKQDPKARPSTSFSADVNAGSTSAFKNSLTTNTGDFLRNTFSSSITFQKTWPGKPFSLNASIGHNQNTITKEVNATLPSLSFGVNGIYPFKRKEAIGKQRWYEKVRFTYGLDAQNKISAVDSTFFTENTLNAMTNGIKHRASLGTSFKAFKYFTVAPTVNYNERWNFQNLERHWDNELQAEVRDTSSGFFSSRDVNANVNMSTNIYGLVQFKKGAIKGIRHVFTPTVGFRWAPKTSARNYLYAGTNGTSTSYSGDEIGIYRGGQFSNTGSVTFAVGNNLEMKVRSKKDSITGFKKVKLLEQFRISSSYNLFADSLNLSDFVISGRTRLLQRFNLNFSMTLSPYKTDTLGNKLHQYVIDDGKELLHLTRSTVAISFNLNGKSKAKEPPKSGRATDAEIEEIQTNPQAFVDFNVPWNLYVSYNLAYTDNTLLENSFTQTLQFNGDVSLTPKWKVGFSSGYDFQNNKLTQTNVTIYRDLHCWEFKFNWVPFGTLQSWSLDLNVKSPVLQDLKLSRRKDWYDY